MRKDLKIIAELRNIVGSVSKETKTNSTSALQRKIKKELGNADKMLSEKMYPPTDSFKKEASDKNVFLDIINEFCENRRAVDNEEMIIKI